MQIKRNTRKRVNSRRRRGGSSSSANPLADFLKPTPSTKNKNAPAPGIPDAVKSRLEKTTSDINWLKDAGLNDDRIEELQTEYHATFLKSPNAQEYPKVKNVVDYIKSLKDDFAKERWLRTTFKMNEDDSDMVNYYLKYLNWNKINTKKREEPQSLGNMMREARGNLDFQHGHGGSKRTRRRRNQKKKTKKKAKNSRKRRI